MSVATPQRARARKDDEAALFPVNDRLPQQVSPPVDGEPLHALDAAEDSAPSVVDPRNKLNALTSKEWIPETVSVWTQRGLGAGHPDAQIERQHPAPFSFTDVSRLVRFFSKPGETVLDPFVGVGSTLKACALEGRRGIGFELNPRYAGLARERIEKEVRSLLHTDAEQEVLEGDSRTLAKQLAPDSVDFVVTSPPYWNILHKEDHKANQERKEHNLDTRYSDDPRDLGNIESYDDFLANLVDILSACAAPLMHCRREATPLCMSLSLGHHRRQLLKVGRVGVCEDDPLGRERERADGAPENAGAAGNAKRRFDFGGRLPVGPSERTGNADVGCPVSGEGAYIRDLEFLRRISETRRVNAAKAGRGTRRSVRELEDRSCGPALPVHPNRRETCSEAPRCRAATSPFKRR